LIILDEAPVVQMIPLYLSEIKSTMVRLEELTTSVPLSGKIWAASNPV
jgi:hypothetical protein